MVRFFYFIFVANLFFSDHGFAGRKVHIRPAHTHEAHYKDECDAHASPVKRKTNSSQDNIGKIFPPDTMGEARKNDEEDKENQTPKRQKTTLTPNSPLKTPEKIILSPTSKERKYWSPIRRSMALTEYKEGKIKCLILSPEVRKIYQENDLGDFYVAIEFEGKKAYQADQLFDPQSKVYCELRGWETNLERMKHGMAPVGHEGIVTQEEKESLDCRSILRKQKKYRIELQHITQKDTGTDQDPICEMTHVAHMGKNASLILEQDPDTFEIRIVASSLEKAQALAQICSPNQFLVTNVLHFRKGNSQIDRDAFDTWRKKYWKNRAEELEKANAIPPTKKKIACKLFN